MQKQKIIYLRIYIILSSKLCCSTLINCFNWVIKSTLSNSLLMMGTLLTYKHFMTVTTIFDAWVNKTYLNIGQGFSNISLVIYLRSNSQKVSINCLSNNPMMVISTGNELMHSSYKIVLSLHPPSPKYYIKCWC